jgi:hypothetical protein
MLCQTKILFCSHYTAQKYALRQITKCIFMSHEQTATGQTYVTETTNKSLKRPPCCIHESNMHEQSDSNHNVFIASKNYLQTSLHFSAHERGHIQARQYRNV